MNHFNANGFVSMLSPAKNRSYSEITKENSADMRTECHIRFQKFQTDYRDIVLPQQNPGIYFSNEFHMAMNYFVDFTNQKVEQDLQMMKIAYEFLKIHAGNLFNQTLSPKAPNVEPMKSVQPFVSLHQSSPHTLQQQFYQHQKCQQSPKYFRNDPRLIFTKNPQLLNSNSFIPLQELNQIIKECSFQFPPNNKP